MATICSYMLLNTGKEKEGIEMASNATNQIKSNQIKSNQIKSNSPYPTINEKYET